MPLLKAAQQRELEVRPSSFPEVASLKEESFGVVVLCSSNGLNNVMDYNLL